eukprot:COSAG02_NODE_6938_length_3275_cov_104.393302_3_plen_89_part_01
MGRSDEREDGELRSRVASPAAGSGGVEGIRRACGLSPPSTLTVKMSTEEDTKAEAPKAEESKAEEPKAEEEKEKEEEEEKKPSGGDEDE